MRPWGMGRWVGQGNTRTTTGIIPSTPTIAFTMPLLPSTMRPWEQRSGLRHDPSSRETVLREV